MKRAILSLFPLFFLAGCWHGHAEVPVPESPTAATDPPGRVARLSYTSGAVSFLPAGTEAWVAAELNRPLTAGDELWTDDNARAELDLGHAFVRIDARTNIAILNLDDRGVQISLLQGTAQVRLRRLDEQDEFEIATPQAAILLLRTGDYRIEARTGGVETVGTVRSGQIEVTAPSQAFSVRAQQQARISGTEAITYEIVPAPPLDGFDDFCRTRERTETTESQKHVSPEVIGRDDLDIHGTWRIYAAWGPVWFPRAVATGWAPYRFGHWVWIEPWGWTWIDDAPWGFAPFHYGRWVFVDARWGWVPGPIHIRPVYAPALVVFAGGGPGFRYYFSVGAGLGVAWFPLGPREVYIPPYRASRTYITNVNISHTVINKTANIWRTDMTRQRYANREVAGALTAVPEDVFTRGRPVARDAVRVTPREMRDAHIGGSAPPVTPNRGSIGPARDGGPPAPRPPDGVARRQTTVRRTPAPPPVPFEQKGPVLDRDPGRPPDPGAIEEMRSVPPAQQPRQHRQVRPPERDAGRTAPPVVQPAPPPAPARPEATPRRSEPQLSPRGAEDRRRTIEQERQRATAQPPRSGPSKQQPGRRR